MEKNYYVYIVTNKRKSVLYTGVTNDLYRRILEHKEKKIKGFSKRYNTDILVYFEHSYYVNSAIMREKQLKAGSRKKKEELINSMNPEWRDLSEDFLDYPEGESTVS